MLKRQITRRFGELPEWAKQRIDDANIAQLEILAEAIFDAKNIEVLLEKL